MPSFLLELPIPHLVTFQNPSNLQGQAPKLPLSPALPQTELIFFSPALMSAYGRIIYVGIDLPELTLTCWRASARLSPPSVSNSSEWSGQRIKEKTPRTKNVHKKVFFPEAGLRYGNVLGWATSGKEDPSEMEQGLVSRLIKTPWVVGTGKLLFLLRISVPLKWS